MNNIKNKMKVRKTQEGGWIVLDFYGYFFWVLKLA